MKNSKMSSFLSLASRARKIISGVDMVVCDLKSSKRKTKLLIIAEDAKENVKKEINFLADKYNIEIIEYLTKEELGHLIGKGERSVVGILDENFKIGILNCIEKGSD